MTTHSGEMASMTLFRSHFDRIRRRLEAEGNAAKSFHHGLEQRANPGSVHSGVPWRRISRSCGESEPGEIFDGETREGETRNQIDVVIHNKRYPRLPLAAGIDLFFIETVSSTIEIKSRLTKEDVRNAAAVAKRIKSLARFDPQRFNPTGMVKNPRPYSFIFAYEGPAKIETVLNWMMAVSKEDGFGLDDLRNSNPGERGFFNHLFVDGVFVLGKGFVAVDSLPFESTVRESHKTRPSRATWRDLDSWLKNESWSFCGP